MLRKGWKEGGGKGERRDAPHESLLVLKLDSAGQKGHSVLGGLLAWAREAVDERVLVRKVVEQALQQVEQAEGASGASGGRVGGSSLRIRPPTSVRENPCEQCRRMRSTEQAQEQAHHEEV